MTAGAHGRGTITISTRRFFCRPSSVVFGATGWLAPRRSTGDLATSHLRPRQQKGAHRGGARLREALVVGIGADVVGVPFHRHRGIRVGGDASRRLGQMRLRRRPELGAVDVEENRGVERELRDVDGGVPTSNATTSSANDESPSGKTIVLPRESV